MNRLHPIDPATAEGKAKTLLDGVKASLGSTPNMFRLLAASPATLEAYLSYNRALSHGVLPAKVREQIALVAAETNGCDYCASAHTALGKHAGLSQDARTWQTKETIHRKEPKENLCKNMLISTRC